MTGGDPNSVARVPAVSKDLLVVIPVFNDWAATAKLLGQLEAVVEDTGLNVGVMLVDDGSTVRPDREITAACRVLCDVEILELRRNLGHQRAIAVALAFVAEERAGIPVAIMDGDGEDLPSELPRLLERYRSEAGQKVVFAERTRRTENVIFRIFYLLYRIFHRLLTGHKVKVGNYSVIPPAILQRLVVLSELWNHYAAAVFKGKIPYTTVPTSRGHRLEGESHMNFVSLVVHGLSAISVYAEVVSVRLLATAAAVMGLTMILLGVTVGVRLGTDLAIPGWATYTSGLLLILFLLSSILAFFLAFVLLASRSNLSFLPIRDYRFFISGIRQLAGE